MTQSPSRHAEASDFCREILPSVSRTFALGIRVLPGELGAAVRCAYLLCRIADTIEDAPHRSGEEKAAALDELSRCFDDPSGAPLLAAGVRDLGSDAAHVRLVRNADLVFIAYGRLPEQTRAYVRQWVREMIGGMRKFVLAYPAGVRIQSLEEYREYCYYVAGTVGYLLTDLWHEHSPSIGAEEYERLRVHCRAFAEALQTVNILKDIARDAEHENSIYLPEQLLRAHGGTHDTLLAAQSAQGTRAAIATLTQLAWDDLDQATTYLLTIPRRAIAIRLFCALPLVFAYATLRDLVRAPDALAQRRVVKISRGEVKSLTILSMIGVMSNSALARLVERARTRPLRWVR